MKSWFMKSIYIIKCNEKNNNSRNGTGWTPVSVSPQPFKFTQPVVSTTSGRTSSKWKVSSGWKFGLTLFSSVKYFHRRQICITRFKEVEWESHADSNSTSVYSRCRNKPRILNIYENLYIYSIYLTSMILADENFPDSRYGANMTQDETRVKGKEKKQKYELIIWIYIKAQLF